MAQAALEGAVSGALSGASLGAGVGFYTFGVPGAIVGGNSW